MLTAFALAGATMLGSVAGHAQGANDERALALARQAIDEHYLAMNMDQALATLNQALGVCQNQCSPKALAIVHLDLAVVYIAGLNQAAQGDEQMKLAVASDPGVVLNPDLATPEVKAAYQKAGGQGGSAPAASAAPASPAAGPAGGQPPNDAAVSQQVSLDEAGSSGDAQGSDALSRHWLSLSVQKDYMLHRDTQGVCFSETTTGSPAYACKNDQGQTWGYRGEEGIDPNPGNNTVHGGTAPSTTRVMLGYDYALSANLMLGARLGLAFGGVVHDELANEKPFFPYHAEARGQYVFGDAPLSSAGVRPYLAAGAGLGQFDSFVQVEFYTASDPGPDGRKYTLNAWRRAGNTFVMAALGLEYALTPSAALFVEAQGLQLFGEAANVLSLRLGFRYGL